MLGGERGCYSCMLGAEGLLQLYAGWRGDVTAVCRVMRGDVTAVCWVVRGCYSCMLGGEGMLQLYAGW